MDNWLHLQVFEDPALIERQNQQSQLVNHGIRVRLILIYEEQFETRAIDYMLNNPGEFLRRLNKIFMIYPTFQEGSYPEIRNRRKEFRNRWDEFKKLNHKIS